MLNKYLAVGTVQFGLDYGAVNNEGQVSLDDAREILDFARDSGMDTLDTAAVYGNSEERLGELNVSDWQIVSKLPKIPSDCTDVTDWVNTTVKTTLSRIRVPKLYGLLLHYPHQLFEKNGDELYGALSKLVSDGVIDKIGVSIYSPDELDSILERFTFNLVQAPFNPFDQRLVTSGWIKKLKEKNIELHVRSIFLQGILVTEPNQLPSQFTNWKPMLNRWHKWLDENKITPVEACLRHALGRSEVSRVIVGINNINQLKDILDNISDEFIDIPSEFQCSDLNIIEPSRWNKS